MSPDAIFRRQVASFRRLIATWVTTAVIARTGAGDLPVIASVPASTSHRGLQRPIATFCALVVAPPVPTSLSLYDDTHRGDVHDNSWGKKWGWTPRVFGQKSQFRGASVGPTWKDVAFGCERNPGDQWVDRKTFTNKK